MPDGQLGWSESNYPIRRTLCSLHSSSRVYVVNVPTWAFSAMWKLHVQKQRKILDNSSAEQARQVYLDCRFRSNFHLGYRILDFCIFTNFKFVWLRLVAICVATFAKNNSKVKRFLAIYIHTTKNIATSIYINIYNLCIFRRGRLIQRCLVNSGGIDRHIGLYQRFHQRLGMFCAWDCRSMIVECLHLVQIYIVACERIGAWTLHQEYPNMTFIDLWCLVRTSHALMLPNFFIALYAMRSILPAV